MKRRAGVVVGVVGIALIAAWWLRRGGEPAPTARSGADQRTAAGAIRSGSGSDPRTQPRGSISGAITDGAAPVAGASVCASADGPQLPSAVTRSPACAASDDRGHYKIANLLAADYTVAAGAPQFLPGAFHPRPDAMRLAFALAAGETRTGVDVALSRGGVEVTGLVRDISGGPVPRAQVRASSRTLRHQGPTFDTDEHGKFSAWVERGYVAIEVYADGYAASRAFGNAPGTFEIALTPASSLGGRVVDAATEQPVAGARVELENTSFDGAWRESDITDAQGAFRVEHLTPGRFTAVATAEHGYGRSEGSTLVGLGQSVDGVVVKLYPAHRVAGRVVIGRDQRACTEGDVSLNDMERGRWLGARAESDGSLVITGVLPGTYRVSISCEGHAFRDDETLAVRDADVTGRVWQLDEGARIRGRVVTRSGATVAEAQLMALKVGGAGRDAGARATARSQQDGSYELVGLKPGVYRVEVKSDRGVSPRDGYSVSVAAAATVEQDLALEDGGTVTGTVVDEDGKPVPTARVEASPGDGRRTLNDNEATTDARGAFSFEALRPGDYRVRARRSWDLLWRRPGADSRFDGANVTVRAGETATVKLLVESQNGTITGTVVDAAGAPVADAFVSSARDFDPGIRGTSSVARSRHSWGDAPLVLTSPDGRFTLERLAEGTYAVVAYRKGGGEAYAEHLALGATVKLQIKPTGSIEGSVRSSGAPLQDLKISVEDDKTGFTRSETFYRTGGRFKLDGLPAGHFSIVATGGGGQKTTTVDLADGEVKTGVELALEGLVTVTGRLVDQAQKPIPGIRMFIRASAEATFSMSTSPDFGPETITDDSGKFTVTRIPVGQVMIVGLPAGGPSPDADYVHAVRMVAGSGTVDLGEVRVIRPRARRGEPRGKLGIRFAEQPEDTPPDKTELKIASIDPGGSAAKTALRVGDVITSLDGVDVTGEHGSDFWTLMQAPPGTRVTIGTQRGVTVTATLGPSEAPRARRLGWRSHLDDP